MTFMVKEVMSIFDVLPSYVPHAAVSVQVAQQRVGGAGYIYVTTW